MEWGVVPRAMIGYSLGEYVAACLAGVLLLEDAVRLVAARARRIDALPEGAMLAVSLPEDAVLPLLGAELSLAAVNGPELSVVAGPPAAVAELEARLAGEGMATRRLRTTHAFHSRMMEPAAAPLTALARGLRLAPPRIPFISNVTGTWITAEQATDPGYWAEHLQRPVRFGAGVGELWREPGRVLLEIGPGQSLATLALQHPAADSAADPVALGSLPSVYERRPEQAVLLDALGKLWLAGAAVDWPAVYGRERRRRVVLPTYPLERRRYWLEAPSAAASEGAPATAPSNAVSPAPAGLYLPARGPRRRLPPTRFPRPRPASTCRPGGGPCPCRRRGRRSSPPAAPGSSSPTGPVARGWGRGSPGGCAKRAPRSRPSPPARASKGWRRGHSPSIPGGWRTTRPCSPPWASRRGASSTCGV
jgi:acyl transferase domain-containing protein